MGHQKIIEIGPNVDDQLAVLDIIETVNDFSEPSEIIYPGSLYNGRARAGGDVADTG